MENKITFYQFISLIKEGAQPIVRFNAGCEDFSDFDAGQLASCISAIEEEENLFEITADFSDFVLYNQSLETENWYSSEDRGERLIKWSNTAHYPKDFKSTFYIDAYGWEKGLVTLHDDDVRLEFLQEFKDSGYSSYVSWLEVMLYDARQY